MKEVESGPYRAHKGELIKLECDTMPKLGTLLYKSKTFEWVDLERFDGCIVWVRNIPIDVEIEIFDIDIPQIGSISKIVSNDDLYSFYVSNRTKSKLPYGDVRYIYDDNMNNSIGIVRSNRGNLYVFRDNNKIVFNNVKSIGDYTYLEWVEIFDNYERIVSYVKDKYFYML
jgi:hypothetical protein